ncbi:MAG: hypothetical protein JWO80_5017 [Bryobacterales bacterium]|nr:hypothetical protein [Bryobacterales bacterium]
MLSRVTARVNVTAPVAFTAEFTPVFTRLCQLGCSVSGLYMVPRTRVVELLGRGCVWSDPGCWRRLPPQPCPRSCRRCGVAPDTRSGWAAEARGVHPAGRELATSGNKERNANVYPTAKETK